MKSYKLIISGKVQGVYYRRSVQVHALQAGFSGYVRNLAGGEVEAAVTCDEVRLTEFLSLLWEGSDLSLVEEIRQTETGETFSGPFEVR